MCECVSAALEQVGGDRSVYLWAGFACALVAVGFSVKEFRWMKQNKIDIGVMDVIGFVAAGLQILSCGMQVSFAYAHKEFPIKFSPFSLMFAIISVYHRMTWKSGTHRYVMYCEENSYCLPLTERERGKHSANIYFQCTGCYTSLHPHQSGRDENYVINSPPQVVADEGEGGVHDDSQGSPRQSSEGDLFEEDWTRPRETGHEKIYACECSYLYNYPDPELNTRIHLGHVGVDEEKHTSIQLSLSDLFSADISFLTL
ncbi:hypothetical protein RHSIM_Rhsim06G0025700 [Rhododendron simsii]|uniref:Uncharacterized protein n=1 Tax=Rhododendron simsii TaxID=118357 RepID=A0A834GR22_RHOSS|nr:hypothetical protein RHSIM_Rhsim06G0025700 [Rhododendron simsii]